MEKQLVALCLNIWTKKLEEGIITWYKRLGTKRPSKYTETSETRMTWKSQGRYEKHPLGWSRRSMVFLSDGAKILRDFQIQTHKMMIANQPDIASGTLNSEALQLWLLLTNADD